MRVSAYTKTEVCRQISDCLREASREGITEFSIEEFSCAYFREIYSLPIHLVTFPCKNQQRPIYTHIFTDLATHLWELFISKIFDQTNDNDTISDFPFRKPNIFKIQTERY